MKKMFILILMIAALSYGCSQVVQESRLVFPNDIEVSPDEWGMNLHIDYSTANSLDTLILESEYIFLGYYSDNSPERCEYATLNSDGLDAINYIEGLQYTFIVDEVLKGDIDSYEIPIVLSYGYRKDSESNYILLDNHFYKPKEKEQTIVFLGKGTKSEVYYPGALPFEYSIDYRGKSSDEKNSKFSLLSNFDKDTKNFGNDSTITMDTLIDRLKLR